MSTVGCQRIDTVHDAKSVIVRDLDVIRDRFGRPRPREVIDRADPAARLTYARAFVEARQAAGRGSSIDPDSWTLAVDSHLKPAPDDRPWLSRRGAGRCVPLRAVVDPDEAARVAAGRKAAAARAAWEHLHGVGYAGDGADGDLVTELLAADMPGPRPVVIVNRVIDQAGDVTERVTQADLWDADDYPGGDAA